MTVNSTRNSVSSTRLKVGDKLGASEVGEWVVGKFVCVGLTEVVGEDVGPAVGLIVEGESVGPTDGLIEGESVGDSDVVGETMVRGDYCSQRHV